MTGTNQLILKEVTTMKLSTIILSSIIALVPLNVLAQNSLSNLPQWIKQRTKPIESTVVYDSGPFSFSIDKNYVPLGNRNYGVVLFQVGNTAEPIYYSQSYYEFNCENAKHIFKGKVSGEIRGGELQILNTMDECRSVVCQNYTRLDSDLIQGIKRFCPSR